MKSYELLYVTDPSNEDNIEDIKKRIEGIITGRGGTVNSFEKLGKKRLAYPIQKRQYGVYYLVYFNGDGRIVQAIDYFIRLNSMVLRHIIISLTEKQMHLKELTETVQKEEAERMRRGGRPLLSPMGDGNVDENKPAGKVPEEKTEEAKDENLKDEKSDAVDPPVVSEIPTEVVKESKPEITEENTEETSEVPVTEEKPVDVQVDVTTEKNME